MSMVTHTELSRLAKRLADLETNIFRHRGVSTKAYADLAPELFSILGELRSLAHITGIEELDEQIENSRLARLGH